MTLKLKYFAAIIALCVATVTSAQTAPEADFAAQLKAASAATRTIECDFTLTRTMSFMDSAITSRGRFHYMRGEGIMLAFTQPVGESITMGREGFKIVAAGRTTIVRGDKNPALGQLRSMLTACMTGDVALLAEGSDVTLSDEGDSFKVRLTPRGRRAKGMVKSITLTFEKEHMSLTELVMEEASGDTSTYRFTAKKFNGPIDPAIFKL